MTDDRFLHEARRDPRPEFTAQLRRRLADADEAQRARVRARRALTRRAFSFAAPIAAAVLALVLFPEVRAAAQSFLQLFRVRNFVAVNVDKSRLEQISSLQKEGMDPLRLVGEKISSTPDQEPQIFANAAGAFAAAGLSPREPSYLPNGIRPDTAVAGASHEAQLRVEARKVNELLNTLGIHDVSVPPALDGAIVGVRTPRLVGIRYVDEKGRRKARLVQSPHPEISLPAGLDRAQLAEIGLRVVGLDPAEAKRFASTIDWNSTMLVPVPTGKCTFREVEVKGRKALLIQANPSKDDPQPQLEGKTGRLLLWSDDDRIFALAGDLSDESLVLMAGSIP